MASESCTFKYVCRGCGEGWFFPPSTIQCDWCGTYKPFDGDPGVCRPAIKPPTNQPSGTAATTKDTP